jgi:hypothetical protein
MTTKIQPANIDSTYDYSSLVGSVYQTTNTSFLQANTASNTAVAAFIQANAAFTAANSGSGAAAAGVYANGAFIQANAAFLVANTPQAIANSAAIYANGAFVQANAAFTAANNASDSWVRNQANAAFGTANSASSYANAAFTKANTAGITYTVSNSSPGSAKVGDQWYSSTEDILYEYIYDGSSNVWFDILSSNITANASVVLGLSSRTTVTATTTSLVNNANTNVDITGFKSYALLKIQTSAAAWVRIYSDNASRTADAARESTTDPLPSAGVIAEVITNGAQTILITPGAFGFNSESSPTANIPVNITNLSGAPAAITATLTILQLEA